LKVRYGLLMTVVGHFLVPQIVGAAALECGEPSTPVGESNTQVMFNDNGLKITPGKKVAKVQATVLTPERIGAGLGESELSRLSGTDWNEVSSPDTDFESPKKRDLVRKIRTICSKIVTKEAQELLRDILVVREKMLRVHSERLMEHSQSYFQQLFPNATISFYDKLNGDQLGTKVLIEKDEKSVAYYVKTHSGGIKKSGSSAAETVNPKELLTYALLDALHVGPEVHFFGRDKQHLYIATKDVKADGKFDEYSRLKEDNAEAVFGVLTNLDLKKLDPEVIESMIARDPVSESFVRMMSILDLVARLIRLTDLQTNGGNFGFVRPLNHESFLPLLRIIDFRLVAEKYFQRVHLGDWELFLKGEGFFEDNLDERVEYILQTRDVELRKGLAADIFQHELVEWTNVMSAAVEKVKASIHQLSEISDEDKADLFRKLDEDAKILIENFDFFKQELEVAR
jgi:hypothetical protein